MWRWATRIREWSVKSQGNERILAVPRFKRSLSHELKNEIDVGAACGTLRVGRPNRFFFDIFSCLDVSSFNFKYNVCLTTYLSAENSLTSPASKWLLSSLRSLDSWHLKMGEGRLFSRAKLHRYMRSGPSLALSYLALFPHPHPFCTSTTLATFWANYKTIVRNTTDLTR